MAIRHGNILHTIKNPEQIQQRFWLSFNKGTDQECWPWLKRINKAGYGLLHCVHIINKRRYDRILAHRYSYELLRGLVPDGLELDHLCRNPPCVNPWYLEAVTHRENVLRGIGLTAQNAAKTHCPAGHPYDVSYFRPDRNVVERLCDQCRREKDRRRHRVKKEALVTKV